MTGSAGQTGAIAATPADGALWVFGYGSLMWKPGFPHDAVVRAVARGFRRRFCLRSIRWRGTPQAPGLVLGLAPDPDPAAACHGMAFRVPPPQVAEVRAYLHEREMGTYSYIETMAPVDLDGHGAARALAYVMDTAHPQFVDLPLPDQAAIIARAAGPAGPNRDYLHQTVAHLRALGLREPELEQLDALVRRMAGGSEAPEEGTPP